MSPESPYTIGIYLCFCIAQASFCQCQNPNQGMLAPDRTPKGTMPPCEIAKANAFERVLVQMEKHVGKSVWELIGEDRKIGDDDLRVPIHFVSPSSGCNVRPQHSQLENVAHEPLTLGRTERFAAAPRPACLGDGRRADGGTGLDFPRKSVGVDR